MKHAIAALAILGLPATACAQTPDTPPPPETPDVSTVTEECGEGCTRTTTTIHTAELDADGNQVISKNVEVIELKTGDEELADIDIDIEGDGAVHKKIKVIASADGEITPEMRAKIDAMIADAEAGELHAFKQEGDGVVVLKSGSEAKKMHVIIRDGEEDVIGGSDDVIIDQTENEDGSRTIRITPDDGSGETTVITIQTEKSSKSDN